MQTIVVFALQIVIIADCETFDAIFSTPIGHVNQMIKRFILILLSAIVASVAQTPTEGAEPTQGKQPNFLLILCDDLGYSDLGCYGSEISTPNLDKLAASGRRFSHFYNTARCWPTRSALLTGYYAQQIRRDTVPGVKSGGQGQRPAWAKLLPERIAALGYHSYHSGKWHIDGLPTKNGFEKSYSLQDHDRHFHPKNHTLDDKPLPAVGANDTYYSSTEIASRCIEQLRYHDQQHHSTPFFSFVAFTAPHFPLHAPQELVEKYKPVYRAGWDQTRQQRFQRMKSLGLDFGLTKPSDVEPQVGPPYAFPEAMQKLGPGEVNRPVPWSDLTQEQKEFQTNKMAVHAAMVEAMDQQIGRIIEYLKEDPKRWENTLVMFLSDNGASAEIMVRGDGHDTTAAAGTEASYLCLGPGWSSVANTPFRRHKTWVHEGGIATPMIVHWPAGIQPISTPIATPLHVIDVVPTLLGFAGSPSTEVPGTQTGPSFPGKSFADQLGEQGSPAAQALEREIWWQHEGNRALRIGKMKIVAAGKDAQWELYDLEKDRSETNDLGLERPDDLQRLVDRWNQLTEEFRVQATAQE